MNSIENEDKELLKNFLNRTFFRSWKYHDLDNFGNLEIQVTPACDKKCTYCYYNNYSNDLYPHSIRNKSNIKNNLNCVLDWLDKNDFNPKIELFSGDIFSHKLGMDVFDQVLDYFEKDNKERLVVIPTNSSFLANDEKTEYIENRINKSKDYNNKIGLSLSIDGKYSDPVTRPHIGNKNFYSDEYYEKVFSFAKRNGYGFHPMIYFDAIENWIDNFKWFQDMMKTHDIPWNRIYLLEVRNKGWSKKNVRDYRKFFYFIMSWFFNNICKKDKYEFINAIFDKRKNMNIFSFLGSIGRGIGCSLQSTFSIRLGDLTVNPCHRLSYSHLNAMKLVKNSSEEIVDYEPLNIPFWLSIISLDVKNMPYCHECLIKNFCQGQCLGSCYESTNEPFLPEPTVCRLFHTKMKTFIDFIEDINSWDILLEKMNRNEEELETIKKIMNGRL